MLQLEEKFKDYYSYVNKEWFKTYDLPDEYSRISTFEIISKQIEKQIVDIISDIVSQYDYFLTPNELLLKNIYNKLYDTNTRNLNSNKPLFSLFNKIDEITSWSDLSKMIGLFSILDLFVFLNVSIGLDFKSNKDYIIYITEFNLILPSKDYYSDSKYIDVQKEYITFIKNTLDYLNLDLELGMPHIKDNLAEKIFLFEKTISKYLFKPSQKRDKDLIYNIVSFEELQKLLNKSSSVINLDSIFYYIKELKPDIDKYYFKIMTYNFDYLDTLGVILEEYGLEFIILYLKYFVFVKSSEYLSDEIYDLNFNFFNKNFSGALKKKSEIKRNTSILSNLLGEVIGQKYIEKYYNPKTTELITDMINKIKESSCDIISSSTWMHEKTKKKALNKIKKMKVLIGYSEIIRDYSSLTESNIYEFDLYSSINAFSLYYFKYYLDKLGTKPDDKEWHMNSYETNAYYNPLNNQIVFPAGILQDPFFSPEAEFEVNLGGIGSVIGHEISHGFDDQGRKFDADGNLKEWWLESDIENYKKRVQPIIDQFNKIKLFGINISGKMTLGENIADYTAITIGTNILKKLNVDESKYKAMYKSYANIWKQKIRQNELIKRLHTDFHAPGRYRTNQILSNIPEFKKIYNIDSNHPMYIHPNKCVKLWD